MQDIVTLLIMAVIFGLTVYAGFNVLIAGLLSAMSGYSFNKFVELE